MRSPVIPVLVVIAGLALAWLWWTREPDAPPKFATSGVATANRTQPPSPASSNVPTSASAADAAVKTPAADAPATSTNPAIAALRTVPPVAGQTTTTTQPRVDDPSRPLSSRESIATAADGASTPAPADAAPPGDDAAEGASTTGDGSAANAPADDSTSDAPSGVTPANDSTAATTDPAPDAASTDDPTNASNPASSDEAPVDSPPPNAASEPESNANAPESSDSQKNDSPALDSSEGADNIADWLARQDAAAADGVAENDAISKAAQAFEHEASDPAWAGSTQQLIEASLNAWLAALPDNVRDHMRLAHVECRLAYCQALAFENTSSPQWSKAFAHLQQEPWWHELRFRTEASEAATSVDGYTMYQAYFERDTTPGG